MPSKATLFQEPFIDKSVDVNKTGRPNTAANLSSVQIKINRIFQHKKHLRTNPPNESSEAKMKRSIQEQRARGVSPETANHESPRHRKVMVSKLIARLRRERYENGV
jgi:hypothetical protein